MSPNPSGGLDLVKGYLDSRLSLALHSSEAFSSRAAESRRILDDVLAELSPRSRLMLAGLREGKSYSDIGAELGISKQAVHKVAHAALQSLREKLETRGFSGIDSKGFLKSARRDSRAKRDSLPQAARRAERSDGNPAG